MNKYLILCIALCASAPLYTADFSGSATAQGQMECRICLDPKPVTECVELSCSHAYCRECLNELIQAARTARNITQARCPEPSCSQPISTSDMRNITDLSTAEELFEIASKEEIAKMPGYKHCPTPGCTAGFINDNNTRESRECDGCHQTYCTECLVNHMPGTACRYVPDAPADKESARWMKQHTKACPQCNRRVEKTEGCNHMRCGACRHEFCWSCGEDWNGEVVRRTHRGFFNCPGRWTRPDPIDAIYDQLPEHQAGPSRANQINNQQAERRRQEEEQRSQREEEAIRRQLHEAQERMREEERRRQERAAIESRRLEQDLARRINEAQQQREQRDAEYTRQQNARRQEEELRRQMAVAAQARRQEALRTQTAQAAQVAWLDERNNARRICREAGVLMAQIQARTPDYNGELEIYSDDIDALNMLAAGNDQAALRRAIASAQGNFLNRLDEIRTHLQQVR